MVNARSINAPKPIMSLMQVSKSHRRADCSPHTAHRTSVDNLDFSIPAFRLGIIEWVPLPWNGAALHQGDDETYNRQNVQTHTKGPD